MRLKNRVEELETELKEMHETMEFALEYGKDTINVWNDIEAERNLFEWWHRYYICARYLKNGKVCEIKKEIPYDIEKDSISIEKNSDGTYFIKCQSFKTIGEKRDVYFQLKKDTGEIIDITEIKEHFENQEKITENLKESAKGLADAFSSLFSTKDTPKAEKVRKLRAKKTEKVDEPKTEKKSKKKGDK